MSLESKFNSLSSTLSKTIDIDIIRVPQTD